ncbi:hypothetical protein CFP65_0535 [Kitasatospora sp. MMS16-BH015]|uniref:DUF6585 family protein n=1 Tax=Kitasatospora sp. MMS16-BH015 TaxID=2018025 RepID=UPI000CA13E43|nr:DUF6585 family protein [Kitasatospora sp. MMS16-BH015]AUG75497.1 hypothetical protein CFP65_0535 [Kitasatospora sp. MMS16-BH015]
MSEHETTRALDERAHQQAEQASARAALGTHRAAYASMAAAQRGNARGIGIAAVVLGLLTLWAVLGGYPVLAAVPGLPFLMCLLGLASSRSSADRNQGARLDLFERGLTVATPDRSWAVRYAEATVLQHLVRHTQYGRTLRTTYAYLLTDTEGRSVVLRDGFGGRMDALALATMPKPELARDFAGAPEWGPAIQRAVTEARLPEALDRVRAGEKVQFGPLWLTRSEIGAREKAVPWTEVEDVQVKDGVVSIRVAGRWSSLATATVSTIPNFFVFQELAARLLAA